MDIAAFVDTRRKRHLATTLSDFEKGLGRELKRAFNGEIPPAVQEAISDYKASVRDKFLGFSQDFTDITRSLDVQVNGAAVELREQLTQT